MSTKHIFSREKLFLVGYFNKAVYETREFWRESALEKSNSNLVIEDNGTYILSYNTKTKMSLNLSFFDLGDINEFPEILEDAKKIAKKEEIPLISINTRRSDELNLSDLLKEHEAEMVVELSLCGRAIDDEIIESLSQRQIPESYKLKILNFEDIQDNIELYEMINDSFPDAFVSSPAQAKSRIATNYENGVEDNQIQSYFIISHENDGIVGFAKSSQITKRIKKGMVHLVLAVVDEDHRKKGLYKELLRARFVEGQKNNGVFAYTESDVTTSRPILERLGLEEIDRMQIYHLKL